jgi:hypothetical protein
MLDVEKIVEQYKAKGGTEEKIIHDILTQCDEERKNWLVSIISQYSDLSKLDFLTLVDIRHDESINMVSLDKYVRACLEDRDTLDMLDEYLESKSKTDTKEMPNIKVNPNKITCKMYPGSTDVETTYLVNGLYDAAKQWYGAEYDQRLKDTIKGTLFYECREDESCIDVEERFSGVKHSEEEKRNLAGVVGMTIKLDKGNGEYQPIVVYKKTPFFDYTATLAHELFYHQFCRQSNFEVENKEGKKFYRDGIALLSQEQGLRDNEALNEGLADYNATEIMRIYTGNPEYKLDPRRLYAPLQEYAEQIASVYDRKQLIKMITTGTPTIEELTKAEDFDFNTFSGYLDMYLRTQNFKNIKIADMFFERFRAEHGMSQAQSTTPRNPADEIFRINNRSQTFEHSQYGTTGIRPKRSFAIGEMSFKSRIMTPDLENIDALKNRIRMLEELIRSTPQNWRDTND